VRSVDAVGTVSGIADRYVEEWARLDPVGATYVGIAGHDAALTDLSPDGYAARADLDRRTMAELATVQPADADERVAQEAMLERLGVAVELYDAGEVTSELSVISSALHAMRGAFDLMPTDGEEAASAIARRFAAIPAALEVWQRTLSAAADAGHIAASHQIDEVAKHCERWTATDGDDFFPLLARRAGTGIPPALRAELERGAAAATAATAATGRFLRTELAPRGRSNQAAGRERYQLASRNFLGTTIDLDEAYAWGFDDLARIESEMRATATRIVPGGSVDEAVAALDADPARTIVGKDAFQSWMQRLADDAISFLDGRHFDIPGPIRRIECMLAPTSDGGIYYTGPSEDFSRPGRMWWAVPPGVEEFSTWREVSTVYHEGAPGHHMQIGHAAMNQGLNRWQRLLCWCSGHGEGWALYAERLMDELGRFADPGERLGMLDSQALRAARVIVDIGMHLELTIPRDNPFGFHPGERWTPELGWEFMRSHTRVQEDVLRFELNRYLGWPGQAPSYKIGERIWLRARARAKAVRGASFDLATFHREALDLGALGLGPFTAALGRL
jgi:uncharacterized protein (DUF885 family)